MINLLPPEGKKKVHINYWLRVTTVYMTLLAVALLISTALLLPTYFYISYQIQAYSETLSNDEEKSIKQIEADITKANQVSGLLLKTPQITKDSELLDEIQLLSEQQVFISNITIRKKDRTFSEIVVNGVAKDRNSLVEFKNKAESHRFFKDVNLPLSNLAKDSDISFSLSLVPTDVLKDAI